MKLRSRRLIFDIETNGLLHHKNPAQIMDRIHLIGLRDIDTRDTFIFRRNKTEDNLARGIAMMNAASLLVGHNIVGFDMPAIWKVYGDEFAPTGKVRDSLVMSRMLFSDEKERDFRKFKQGILEGKYLGSHELGAWGQRLGMPKDDYAKRRHEKAEANWDDDPALQEHWNHKYDDYQHWYTWGSWNQDMEDYLWGDLDTTEALWMKIANRPWSETAIILEHQVHELMERVTANGFPFNQEAGIRLADDLEATWQKKSDVAKEHFGYWFVPAKWLEVHKTTTYVNPEGDGKPEKGQVSFRPRSVFGESNDRSHWGEVTVPSKDVKYKLVNVPDRVAGRPFCPIKIIEFNPNSRPQIINRLTKVYGWEPQEFTEAGSPSVGDEILRNLSRAERDDGRVVIPIAEDLAEIFYFKKRMGQLADGPQAWLKKSQEWGDGHIHPRFVVGGTVTNRASHSGPNIAQVPRVVFKKKPMLDDDGQPILGEDGKPKLEEKKSLMKGRDGDHGWDCRNLFIVPDGWVLMGADQKGIELRALGHYMAEFDNGEYGRLVVEADPHDLHQKVMELDSRDTAKTVIYALIYGAQDFKLGITVDPKLELYPNKAKALGAEMRKRLMTRIPALGQVSKAVMRTAKQGYVEALDGRHLFVRAKHAALNTLLQGGGATIAKKWCVLFEQYMEDEGLVHGWNGDFAILAWVHDELQVAVRDDPRIREIARQCIIDAAIDAGKAFKFRLPVDVDTKFGKTWAETH